MFSTVRPHKGPALWPTRSVVLTCRRGCQARSQQQDTQDEKRDEMPQGVDFEFEATNEIPEPDFWDGEQWEGVGNIAKVLIPVLLVSAVIVGVFAAKTYNEGADSYLVSPAPDRPAQIVSAEGR